jgi:hypothetical protein
MNVPYEQLQVVKEMSEQESDYIGHAHEYVVIFG